MSSLKKTIGWNKYNHNLFLDLQHEFKKLNSSRQQQFVKRNGFDLSGDSKNFVESAVIVCLKMGLMTGDIKEDSSGYYIDIASLNKSKLFYSKAWKLPINWEKVKKELDCDIPKEE